MVPQQARVGLGGEGAAIDHQMMVGKRGRLFRAVHEAQQVVVLTLHRESVHMHPAECQHDPARRPGKRRNGGLDIRRMLPAVASGGLPRGRVSRMCGVAVFRAAASACALMVAANGCVASTRWVTRCSRK